MISHDFLGHSGRYEQPGRNMKNYVWECSEKPEYPKIHRILAATKLWGVGLDHLFTISMPCCFATTVLESCWFKPWGMINGLLPPLGTDCWPTSMNMSSTRGLFGQPWKTIQFQACSHDTKSHKKRSQGHPKNMENGACYHQNSSPVNNWCL